jgi:hypothetical protein
MLPLDFGPRAALLLSFVHHHPLPVIAGIIPIKSDKRTVVLSSPDFNALRSAVLNKFSKAVMLIWHYTTFIIDVFTFTSFKANLF